MVSGGGGGGDGGPRTGGNRSSSVRTVNNLLTVCCTAEGQSRCQSLLAHEQFAPQSHVTAGQHCTFSLTCRMKKRQDLPNVSYWNSLFLAGYWLITRFSLD